jgi:hypothetical protein
MLLHKRYFFIAAASLFLLMGCSKDNGSSFNSYLRGKIDGVAFECTSGITANTPETISGPADPTIRITGNWLNNSIRLMIISESSSLASGVYPFDANKNRSGTLYLGADAYYAGPTGGGLTGLPLTLKGSGSITITEVSKQYVKGSFQFTSGPNNSVTKSVTEGDFYVKRN